MINWKQTQTDKVVLDRILAGQQSNIMNMMMTEMNHAVAILAFAMNFQRNPVIGSRHPLQSQIHDQETSGKKNGSNEDKKVHVLSTP